MKRLIAAVLTATTMALAACTATDAPDPDARTVPDPGTSSTAALTTRGSTTPDPAESSPSGTATTGSSPTGVSTPVTAGSSTVTSTTATSTTVTGDMYDAIPVTIPSTITAVGLKSAKAAIPVWRNAVRLYDESMQDPGDDWKAKIREYVGDPAAITQLTLLAAFAKDGVHQIGVIRYVGEVTAATAHNVEIRACVDVSNFDVVNSDGASISEPSTPRRFYRDYNIDFYPDAGHVWLLNLITTSKPAEPC